MKVNPKTQSNVRKKPKGLLMGKDLRPRPMSISKDEFDKRWDKIFGSKK